MKTKYNIQKTINLNAFIWNMSKDYEIITYAESYMFYSFIQYNKIHTLLYADYDIHMFVQGENYCFITAKGNRCEYKTIDKFKHNLYKYLDRLHYINYVIPDILDMIKNHKLSYYYENGLPVWLEKAVR